MTISLVYITASSRAEADRIARALLDARLAACVNILGPIRSLYRWKGRVCRGREVAMLAKTRADRVPALVRAVRAAHSYDLPAIVAVPVQGGHAAFLEWVGEETRPAQRRRPRTPVRTR